MLQQIREATFGLMPSRAVPHTYKDPIRVNAYLTQEGFKELNDDIIEIMKDSYVIGAGVDFNPKTYNFTSYMFPDGILLFIKSQHSSNNTIRIGTQSAKIT